MRAFTSTLLFCGFIFSATSVFSESARPTAGMPSMPCAGVKSTAQASSAGRELETRILDWTEGFLTGLNFAHSLDGGAQRNLATEVLLRENLAETLRTKCRTKPEELLFGVVLELWLEAPLYEE